MDYQAEALREAGNSTCQRAQCGSIIVKDDRIIGRGHNSPPRDLESQRRCLHDKSSYDNKVTDKTCCVHAEQRAIMDALSKHPESIRGSTIYVIRLKDGVVQTGKPYCTICSKMALDAGIARFILIRADGIQEYGTAEYNDRSYRFTSGT